MAVRNISAVTFAVANMTRSVAFYRKLGFEVTYGGPEAPFTSLQAGDSSVNLIEEKSYRGGWWGRTIFRVENADAQYKLMVDAGLDPDEEPQDATWGERYFHISDPDGHELSFAELLTGG